MRIIAGTFRSRILKSLKGQTLRPTSDWLRETLFNVLGPAVSDSRFLDLYAGTGAVGIEALSRGAIEAVFVENHAAAVKLIRENLTLLAKLSSRARPPFDFIFLDPPYAAEHEYELTLDFLAASTLISADSIVIAEHRKTFALAETFGLLQRYRVLKQGDAALSFYRLNPAEK